MQLTATIRTRPQPGARNVDAPDYDTALTDLQQRVPDGWQMLSVRTH